MRALGSRRGLELQLAWCSIAILLFVVTGCSRKHSNSLANFTQQGQRSLAEVVDSRARTWKIASVELHNVVGFFVIDSGGRVAITASIFQSHDGTRHTLEFVDPAEKEDALAVLDTQFLSGLKNPSDAFKAWVAKDAGNFSYGRTQETRALDVKPGGLGSGKIGVQGNTIVALMPHAACHCYENAQVCAYLPSPQIDCWNKCCDFINCIIDVLNGDKSDCNQEQSDAQLSCSLATNE